MSRPLPGGTMRRVAGQAGELRSSVIETGLGLPEQGAQKVEGDYAISDRCPGCGVRLTTGIDGIVEAEEGDTVVYPLSPQSEVETSDAVYIGFHCLQDGQRPVCCPRCGSDVRIQTALAPRTPVDRDHRDFMETPVADLELSIRARNAVHKAGVRVARDLLSLSVTDIQKHVAAESNTVVDEVRRFLAARSLALRGESWRAAKMER